MKSIKKKIDYVTSFQIAVFSFLLSIALALILAFAGLIQKPLAIHMACIHLLTNHLDQGIMLCKGVDTEYLLKFDEYMVEFETLEGKQVCITMVPKEFPVFVYRDSYDSFLN